jgi:hypothetical protein
MATDLPDYEKKVIIVTIPGDYPGLVEIDHRKILGVDLMTPSVAGCLPASIEHIVRMNHMEILGVALKTPTIAQSVPMSIENPAIAYDSENDWFKVDVVSRAARLLGIIYGSQSQQLKQTATNYNLAVELYVAGSAIDPRVITTLPAITGSVTANAGTNLNTSLLSLEATQADIKTALQIIDNMISGNEAQVDIVASLPAGSNAIGKLAANSGVDIGDVDVTSMPNVTVADVVKVATSNYKAPTALGIGGTMTVWTPAAGKAIRAKRIQVSVDAATRIDLRWTTTVFESYYLPANGTIIVNLIGANEQPAIDATLTLLSSAAANVTAKASGDEV